MTSDERKQILKMLAAGKVSVDEAARLLEAVDEAAGVTAAAGDGAGGPNHKGRTLRVRVVEDGKQKVNINVPMGLAKLMLGIAANAVRHDKKGEPGLAGLEELNVEEILRQVEAGLTGKIVEVHDENRLVEVYVE